MILGFSIHQVLLILCYTLLAFNIVKFIKNLRKKMSNEPIKEGMMNKKRMNKKRMKKKMMKKKMMEKEPNDNLEETSYEIELLQEPQPIQEPIQEPLPEPANANLISQYTGIARKSGEYNNRIFNKLEDQINRLLMKDYGENYMEILDRFDYLLSLKMLDNTLTVDFDNEKQMLSRIEKINKYGDAKKFIEEMKEIVSLEMPNNM